jgi:hypothetical protein
LREVLEGPLRFTPEGKTYRFSGPVAIGRVIAGAVLEKDGAPTNMASPAGFENLWIPRFDGIVRRAV